MFQMDGCLVSVSANDIEFVFLCCIHHSLRARTVFGKRRSSLYSQTIHHSVSKTDHVRLNLISGRQNHVGVDTFRTRTSPASPYPFTKPARHSGKKDHLTITSQSLQENSILFAKSRSCSLLLTRRIFSTLSSTKSLHCCCFSFILSHKPQTPLTKGSHNLEGTTYHWVARQCNICSSNPTVSDEPLLNLIWARQNHVGIDTFRTRTSPASPYPFITPTRHFDEKPTSLPHHKHLEWRRWLCVHVGDHRVCRRSLCVCMRESVCVCVFLYW
jgi:hypothetical protein